MTFKTKQENLLCEPRFLWASFVMMAVLGFLALRVWYIQIYRGQHYRTISENNRIRRIEIPAPRGIVYDRNGAVILGNKPFFDLIYIPQYVREKEATFKILSRLLNIPESIFERRLRAGYGRPSFLPIILKRNLTLHEVSVVQSNKLFLPGIDVSVVPRRDYKPNLPPHLVGYLGEISRAQLKKANKTETKNPYLPGDLVGKQGLEAQWEEHLRGKRGYRLIQVDAFGRESKLFEKNQLKLPRVDAIRGSDLILTLDLDLQKASKDAFKGKYGAVIALDPRSGEILSMLSEPGFDPTMYQNRLSMFEWRALVENPFTPLLDKTTGGEFPPGSLYKPVVALAAIEEGVVNSKTKFHCNGAFVLGNQTFHCHNRSGHGIVDLARAMMKSCDIYFYHVGVELGVDKIAQYARSLGLGDRLGLNLNMERPGLVPTRQWKKETFKAPWTVGETPSVSIGQGYNLATPLQMASLYAAIGNGGTIYRPFLVSKVVNPLGEITLQTKPETVSQSKIISQQSFRLIRKALQKTVMDPGGTGHRAAHPTKSVAGKTGSVQVVSLKKNRNQKDVSMKWKEHALFAAFSPAKNPEIVVVVVSENDREGGGGVSAAPVAGKIVDAFWRLKEERKGAKYATRP